ncbi:MAG: hypothetical protein ACRETY_06620, partial [Steroidobacteraceae bacterium]
SRARDMTTSKGASLLGSAGAGTRLRVLAKEMLGALLAIPLLLLLVLVLLQYGQQVIAAVGSAGAYSAYGLAATLAIGVGLLFFAVVKRKTPFAPAGFLACSLTAAAILYYAYISSIEVVWISDFIGMWRSALEMVSSGDYTVQSIHDERVLPVLVPTILLFGTNPAVVPIVNLVLLLGIQLAGYDLARRIAGHRAAQGFVVLWIGAMEPIFALPITSHDIWGLFFLVLFLWGLRVTFERLAAGKMSTLKHKLTLGGCALGLAVVLTLLDMQRELTPIVILGFALGALLLALKGSRAKAHLRPSLMLVATAFLLYGGLTAGLKHSGYMLTSQQGSYLAEIRVGAYGSSLSTGRYGQGQVLYKTFITELEGEARRDLVNAIPLSDLALQPVARIGNIIHRAQGQALLGSQTFFYQSQAKTESDWLLPMTRAYNVCYSIVLAALSLWLILPLLRRLDSLDGLIQLSLLSVLVGLLLLVGESQPRYIFPLWFILPQLVAFALAMRPGIAGENIPVSSIWGWDVTRGTLLILAAYAILALAARWVYVESHGRMLSGWQSALSGNVESPPENWFQASQTLSAAKIKHDGSDRRTAGFGDLALVLKFPVNVQPGGTVSAEKDLCVGEERRTLEFFYFMPYQNPAAEGAFTLEMLVDNRQRWTVQLPGTETITHVRIPDVLPAGTCGDLKFNLRANRGLSRASWVAASQTDVYFPRLVR